MVGRFNRTRSWNDPSSPWVFTFEHPWRWKANSSAVGKFCNSGTGQSPSRRERSCDGERGACLLHGGSNLRPYMMNSVQGVDRVVLEILAHRVRLLSSRQVGGMLAPDAPSYEQLQVGRRWVKRFDRSRLVERYQVVAHEPQYCEPLLHYSLGDATPDFRALSKALRRRSGNPERIDVVRLGSNGAKAFSVAQPRLARTGEEEHELRLAATALELASRGSIELWLSEDALMRARTFHSVVPDALVALRSGEVLAIECGGIYSAVKLQRSHQALVSQLPLVGGHGYLLV